MGRELLALQVDNDLLFVSVLRREVQGLLAILRESMVEGEISMVLHHWVRDLDDITRRLRDLKNRTLTPLQCISYFGNGNVEHRETRAYQNKWAAERANFHIEHEVMYSLPSSS